MQHRESSAKKLTLPAAVFNKTPNRDRRSNASNADKLFSICTPTRTHTSPSMRSSTRKVCFDEKQNSRETGNSRATQTEVCPNHQSKEACYEVFGKSERYCQKCAIYLASQGCKVKKIPLASSSYKQRKTDIDLLYKHVDETLRLLGTKKVQTTQCQIHCKQTFQQQVLISEEYFCEMHKVVDFYRGQTLQFIEHQYNQSQKIQKQLQQVIQDCIRQSNTIKYRLNPKDPNSVCELQQGDFQTTMEVFRVRLSNYKNTVKSWRPDQIVIKPINLCDMDHISNILSQLYHRQAILYEQPQTVTNDQLYNGDTIPQEQTITEDDIML